ncbi:MAG TPA: hypothetical protein VG816_14945, partial [Solirubrobacterales bacterium]|nr:hypothetical protein [Solirubrobacterales bacterium]
MTPPGRKPLHGEEGFVLIEVLVSALVVALVSAAVFTLLQASARSAGSDRQRSTAFALAQEDQARLRTLRIAELARLPTKPREISLNGTTFEVFSTGVFVNDKTATSSCTAESNSADYVRITSEVKWKVMNGRPPVAIQSIVAPANGSLDPSHGALSFSILNAAEQPIPGVILSGSGAGSFSGTTNAEGCATFPDLAAGSYSVTPSGAVAGMVDKDGNAPVAVPASVTAEVTTPKELHFDLPGKVKKITFLTKSSPTGTLIASSSDSVIVSNIGMKEPKIVGTPGGGRKTTIESPSLYPFTEPYGLYGGFCGSNNPNPSGEPTAPGAVGVTSVVVPKNGFIEEAKVVLPALYLTVWKGTSTKPETAVSKPRVTVTDLNCKYNSNSIKRVLETETAGHLIDPGLPFSKYEICADNGSKRVKETV